MLRKSHKGQTPEGESTRRGTGSDQPIVASKPGNAGGAKGLNDSAEGMGQLETGGIHPRSKVVCAA
jgi:hypothetical protein